MTKKNGPSPLKTVGKVTKLLSKRERSFLFLVFVGAIITALIEVVGVGSIMPFLMVASSPEIIETNKYLHWAYATLHIPTHQMFLIILGIAFLVFLVFTNIAKALAKYFNIRFTNSCRHNLSTRMMKGYLRQDYIFFLNRNSFDFVKNVTSEIQNMISGTLMQFVDLITQVVQILFFVIFLFIVNPLSTLIIALSIGIIYGIIFACIRESVKKQGIDRFDLNQIRYKAVSETFWGIKDVKLLGLEKSFIDVYSGPSMRLAKVEAKNEVMGELPKFALETIAFASILVFVLITIIQNGNFQELLGTVGAFAYAGYRMIPAVQNLFKDVTKLRYGAATTDLIFEEFELIKGGSDYSENEISPLGLKNKLELKNISFTYPNTEKEVLNNISIEIDANKAIGFAGTTGSGKTTLIDVILGLLNPSSGNIVVDGKVLLNDNVRAWQASLGYVPQSIYLSNATIAENIAFGIPKDKIDATSVERAAKMAQIHDFIVKDLKSGYETEIGERGIRLSGGQRQRLGIARALYHNPSILVFDEATSALDGQTEEAVMSAVEAMAGHKTVILIAHRLTTLKACQKIYLLEKGNIVDQGTYDELSNRSQFFK